MRTTDKKKVCIFEQKARFMEKVIRNSGRMMCLIVVNEVRHSTCFRRGSTILSMLWTEKHILLSHQLTWVCTRRSFHSIRNVTGFSGSTLGMKWSMPPKNLGTRAPTERQTKQINTEWEKAKSLPSSFWSINKATGTQRPYLDPEEIFLKAICILLLWILTQQSADW